MEQHNSSLPIVGFTLGDINGIGPEIILKTLNDSLLLDQMIPVIFGSNKVFNFYRKIMPDCTVHLQPVRDFSQLRPKQVNIINCWEEQINILPGELTNEGGKYAAISLLAGAKALKEGSINCLVTAPIHKKNIKSNEFNYVGHTPFFQDFFAAKEVIMLMISESMKVALLTEHIALKDVAQKITVQNIMNKTLLLHKILQEDFLISRPRIAVLGLNPHNGDEGLVAKEESEIIMPAVKQLFNTSILAFGPYSADGFFTRGHEQTFDAVLALYHDQGLIPFKSLSLGFGINYTAGLGAVRTSPDHGTAFDIAGKGIADAGSFREAIFKGIDIWRNQKAFKENGANALQKQSIPFYNNDYRNKKYEDKKEEIIEE